MTNAEPGMDPSGAELLIAQLRLEPHPEGGHFRETYRARELVSTERGMRAASTAILFLLVAGRWSRWHRIRSDEVWHHHAGSGLRIYELSPQGQVRLTSLGSDLAAGEQLQHVVPAGRWFAAEPDASLPWSLVGCTVAPGFDFADFELASATQLEAHGNALARICPHWRRLCSA